ncbi:Kinesin-like protein KIF23 [Oopsacas minuta]|uniref:Kinesin-like protein n=1 Tax=Oopsacas minuta TaxID=111878 RepID=A0AAV7KIE7_9METZ|nr:Kinesin-like protein KIF23 [Oopsacas minuta]
MSHNTTGIRIKSRTKRRSLKAKDPVEVFCRLRPSEDPIPDIEDEDYTRCIEIISDTVIQLNPPKSSLAFKSGNKTTTQHTFKSVFQDSATQKKVFDHVARPLVYDLLNGKNGLLFTYGITNSGKTYTMTGSHENSGILPRCLDVIFNSVTELLAKPFVFKSDRLNGFKVQSDEDAGREYRGFRRKKLKGKLDEDSDDAGLQQDRVADESLVSGLDEDNAFAVFVSYFEIYNNYVYDLFEDIQVEGGKVRAPQSKQLREDAKHNMYVSGGVEVEVRSTKDTFALIEKGQKNRRMAETQLNHNSSRSHAIFNLRIVQAPLDPSGEEVFLDNDKVNVSTLSLVDLAGSERTSRTHADGIQLREAGNINASLMVLRTCMETLRDNQSNGATKIVPFRDSKLTHLFKNFFDGEGKVRMVVCVNPRTEDYDETIHVLRFSELTQNVVVDRCEGVKVDGLGLAPGRRRANMLYKVQLKELEEVLKGSNKGAPQPVPRRIPDTFASDTATDTCDPTTSEASSDDAPFRAPPPRIPPRPMRFLANRVLPPLDIEKLLMKDISISVSLIIYKQ